MPVSAPKDLGQNCPRAPQLTGLCVVIACLTLLSLMHVSACNAAGTLLWGAWLVQHPGTASEKDYYANQAYATKAQAIAAMQQLDPYPDERALLVSQAQEKIATESAAATTYGYTVPPGPVVIGPWTYCWNGGCTPTYSSEGAATASVGCQYFEAVGDWRQVDPAPPEYHAIDQRDYVLHEDFPDGAGCTSGNPPSNTTGPSGARSHNSMSGARI